MRRIGHKTARSPVDDVPNPVETGLSSHGRKMVEAARESAVVLALVDTTRFPALGEPCANSLLY